MVSLRPITARVRVKLTGKDIADIADEISVVAQGRSWSAAPMLHLADTFDRVLGHHPEITAEENAQRIKCLDVYQGPTVRFGVDDAIIADGAVLAKNWTRSLTQGRRRKVLLNTGSKIEEAFLCSNMVSERYFGHWLHDQLPLELLVRDLGHTPLTVKGTFRPNEVGYRTLTGLRTHEVTAARARRMWIFQDFELNDNRAERLNRLRTTVRNAVKPGGPSKIFIGRGPSATGRALVNEVEIATMLTERGFTYLVPEHMEAHEIAYHIRDAKILVGPEGSAHAHGLVALPSGATLFQFMPPRQLNLHFRIYAEALGLRYAADVGLDIDEHRYAMPLDRIAKMLDMIE